MRALLLSIFMLPSAALAEVCDKERPLWDGTPITAWSEAVILMTHPFQVILLAATLFAIWARARVVCFILALLWIGYIPLMLSRDLNDITWAAIREGCIGSTILFMGLCGAISMASFYSALVRRKTKRI